MFLSVVYQLPDYLEICILRSPMIWPRQVMKLYDFSELLAVVLPNDLEFSSDKVCY